jgi:uncharacterized protein
MTEEQSAAAPGRRPRTSHAVVVIAVLLAAAALVVAVTRAPASAAARPPDCGGSSPHLTVQGTGTASGPPDELDFQAQVSVNAASAQSALGEDSATTSDVVRAIESAGVKAKDVETTGLSINPNYADENGRSIISSYGVTNSISVTVGQIAQAGSVIDAASSAGGNDVSIDGLSFAEADPRMLQDRAREDAVRQAVTHASAMARAAGERLGGVCSLTDQSGISEPQPLLNGAHAAAGASAPPLEGGTQQASAEVTLVYALEPSAR